MQTRAVQPLEQFRLTVKIKWHQPKIHDFCLYIIAGELKD